MNIGILSFYREINFGATLQGLSTFYYLKKAGYNPIFINYYSKKKDRIYTPLFDKNEQTSCFRTFVDEVITTQTPLCHNAEEINEQIEKYKIDAIIVGSDAVMQHHPFINRIKYGGKRILRIIPQLPDTTFPNPFWGVGINDSVKMALMSVSTQNSEYTSFSTTTKDNMYSALKRFTYYSVRDTWSKKVLAYVSGGKLSEQILITPDPVFNFNDNVGHMIFSKKDMLDKFNIPEKYTLISLHEQSLSYKQLIDLKRLLAENEISCVALPTQFGTNFRHPFDYSIPSPLTPLEWYSLIKYSSGYVGNNMHPIVVALHNSVPCYSIDIWGNTDFFGKKKKDGSSKVLHIMSEFGVANNIANVNKGKCNVNPLEIVSKLLSFPTEEVAKVAEKKRLDYNKMMKEILESLK